MRFDKGGMIGRLRDYATLFRSLLLRGYRGKVLLVAFLGVHVPLISLVIYLAFVSPSGFVSPLATILVALAATLVGTAATLYALNAILTPVALASQALRDYVERGEKPELPEDVIDRSGRLLLDLRYTVDQAERMSRAIQSLEDLSSRDYLTGAYNRRGCEEHLEEDLARLRRSGGVLTLAVLDVDHFKRINDEYGHQVGDVCLRYVAEIIEKTVRRGDWLARWGGDEFVLALWDARPGSSASMVLDRIVNTLHESPAQLPHGKEIYLSLSGGAYRCTGDEDVQQCFALADDALRRAKREGRSRMIYEA